MLIRDDSVFFADEMILDECFSLFFAGSFTTQMSHLTLLWFMQKNPEILQKCRDDVRKNAIEPYLKENPG